MKSPVVRRGEGQDQSSQSCVQVMTSIAALAPFLARTTASASLAAAVFVNSTKLTAFLDIVFNRIGF